MDSLQSVVPAFLHDKTAENEDFSEALRDYCQSRVARFLQFTPWSGQIMIQIWIAIEINIKVHSEHKRGNAVKLKYYLQLRSKWFIEYTT